MKGHPERAPLRNSAWLLTEIYQPYIETVRDIFLNEKVFYAGRRGSACGNPDEAYNPHRTHNSQGCTPPAPEAQAKVETLGKTIPLT